MYEFGARAHVLARLRGRFGHSGGLSFGVFWRALQAAVKGESVAGTSIGFPACALCRRSS
jgi:hypothetical protein